MLACVRACDSEWDSDFAIFFVCVKGVLKPAGMADMFQVKFAALNKLLFGFNVTDSSQIPR